MKYAGRVFSGNILVGHICADSMTVLKRKASKLCNRDYQAINMIILHQVNGKEACMLLMRVNKFNSNNKVVRGVWQRK